jgi:lipoate-protein ligase B
MTACEVIHLGRIDYDSALALQERLVAERSTDSAPDRLLLLEHPHTYTLGSSAKPEHLLLSPDEIARQQIRVLRVDRGGDITYHGPGQLVGYPIIALPRAGEGLRTDFVGYLRRLETVLIGVLGDYGLRGKVIPGLTGVWVDTPTGEAKVAAIGVKINVKAVTKHGFALNVAPDMRLFEGIVPCGIHDKAVTSLAQLLPQPPTMDDVMQHVTAHFGDVFGLEMQPATLHDAVTE